METLTVNKTKKWQFNTSYGPRFRGVHKTTIKVGKNNISNFAKCKVNHSFAGAKA